MEHFGDIGSLDVNVESFLSHDDGDGRDLFGTLKRNPSEQAAETSKSKLPVLMEVIIVYIDNSNDSVFCFQVSHSTKSVQYAKVVAKLSVVTSLQMESYWPVRGMTRRYTACKE